MPLVDTGRLKMRDWHYRHHQKCRGGKCGTKQLLDWNNCRSSSFMFQAIKLSATVKSSVGRYTVVSEILTVLYTAILFFNTSLRFGQNLGVFSLNEIHDVICHDFQACDHKSPTSQTERQTDRQTDGRHVDFAHMCIMCLCL